MKYNRVAVGLFEVGTSYPSHDGHEGDGGCIGDSRLELEVQAILFGIMGLLKSKNNLRSTYEPEVTVSLIWLVRGGGAEGTIKEELLKNSVRT